jgi:Domain of unknown function (DUF5979)
MVRLIQFSWLARLGRHRDRRSRLVLWRALAVGLITLGAVSLLYPGMAKAQVAAPAASASDPRATFVDGNVVTCAEAGITAPAGSVLIQMGSDNNNNAADVNVSGVVAPHTPEGEEVNVTLLNSSVVIDAVVVKGGPAYNLYTNPTFLPPTLLAPQHYISPFNSGGNIPTISHWFVCYHLAAPPTGSISVSKTVIGASGVITTTPPTSYSALVTCRNPAGTVIATGTVTFESGGGLGTPDPVLTGLPINTVCTVVEQSPPSGAVVSYTPAGANTTGVTVTGTSPVEVGIANDFSGDAVETGTLQLAKAVVNSGGATAPSTFTAQVLCNDSPATGGTVTLPGTGGPGTPTLTPEVGFACAIEETSVPGWTATYSVNGGPATSTAPFIVDITSATTTVTVTITNTATTTTTTTTTAPTTTTTTPSTGPGSETTTTTTHPVTVTTAPPAAASVAAAGSTGSTPSGATSQLPATGARPYFAIFDGLLAILIGCLLLVGSRLTTSRPKPSHRKGRRRRDP